MVDMATLTSLGKRRGFIFQSSEIYEGIGGCWDYGPLGAELKNNIKRLWWRDNIHARNDMVGIDASILMNSKVWEASGHISGFSDPLVECKNCHHRFKAGDVKKNCRDCGGLLTEARQFNLMFKTNFGPVEDGASIAYLRPETAQGIFVNFENVMVASRKKLPFGIGQVGKSFRNEISPGNYIFRSREFEQMEIEYFVKPGTDEEHHKKWIDARLNWYVKYGMRKENLHLREHAKDELAHYAKACTDIEYNFPMGWSELEGIANRTDFDLKQHAKFSGKELSYFNDETKEHIVPYVIEPSAGVDRSLLAFTLDAYNEEMVRGEKRVVLKFHKELAPIKIAVLPLLKKRDDIVKCALEITDSLKKHFMTVYDDTASIGKLYRRQDEVGTPFCITVDVQTIEEDKNVTVRERDTMEQIRAPLAQIVPIMKETWEEGWQKAVTKYPKQATTTSS